MRRQGFNPYNHMKSSGYKWCVPPCITLYTARDTTRHKLEVKRGVLSQPSGRLYNCTGRRYIPRCSFLYSLLLPPSNNAHRAPDETMLKAIATAMNSTGLQALGYEYVNLDAGWSLTARDPTTKRQAVLQPRQHGSTATTAARQHGSLHPHALAVLCL